MTFLGKRSHVERIMPLAHVLLLPSELESFGLVALEAMACGVPPVTTRVGGLPEVVTDGVTGFMEAPGDIPALSARAVQLLTDDKLYAQMSGAARMAAQSKFCTSIIIPIYEEYYREICSR